MSGAMTISHLSSLCSARPIFPHIYLNSYWSRTFGNVSPDLQPSDPEWNALSMSFQVTAGHTSWLFISLADAATENYLTLNIYLSNIHYIQIETLSNK